MPHHATPADLPTAAMLLIDNCGNKDVTIPPDDLVAIRRVKEM